MYAVEFQAPIENGIVRIPTQYQEIQNNTKATFVVMYNYEKVNTNQNSIDAELDELFDNSNNKVQVTMELATNTDEMTNDGIL
jgi:peptidoglycan hydrolase CwlO-like protein